MPGSITRRHHSEPPTRKLAAASFRSPGKAAAPAMTLNRMYHCVPSSISGVSQMSGSSAKCTITTTNSGKNRLAGNAARNCATGCAQRAQRGRSPNQTPIGTHTAAEISDDQQHPQQREAAVEQGGEHIAPVQRAGDEAHDARRRPARSPPPAPRATPDRPPASASAGARAPRALPREPHPAHPEEHAAASRPTRHAAAASAAAAPAARGRPRPRAATISKRNLADHATSGRNRSWS